jgi:hypothetical protein
MDSVVTPLHQLPPQALQGLLSEYGLALAWAEDGAAIPGSYWGDSEAGLVGDTLWVRRDTPVHSALHEACHWLCVDGERRAKLHTDANGGDIEENAVCYLQALLAERLPGYSQAQLFADMDAWGYHFRLGSTQAWFERDAEDALAFLQQHGLVDAHGRLSGQRRS